MKAVATARPARLRGLPAVCAARVPNAGNGGPGPIPRSGRPAAPRAAPSPSAEAPAAALAAAPPAGAVGATPVALPAALQGTLLQPKTGEKAEARVIKSSDAEPRPRGPKTPSHQQAGRAAEGKRRDRRRRRLHKQRAEVAVAVAAVVGAMPASKLALDEHGGESAAQGKQRRRRRRRQVEQQPDTGRSSGSSSRSRSRSSSSDGRGGQQERERQIPITSKDEDWMRWYDDVTAAAEQAYKPAAAARAAFRRRRDASAAAAGPEALEALVQSFQPHMQGWLAERLEYMGFEARQFPPLQPLDAAWRQQQQQARQAKEEQEQQAQQQEQQRQQAQQEDEQQQQLESKSQASSSSSSNASSTSVGPGRNSNLRRGCTTATFARWSEAAGGQLPLLASQWHRGGASWELEDSAGILHEAHAAHEWGGAADEHARAMIGMYEEFALEAAGLPVVAGRLPASAAMPGAAVSYSLEAVLPGGRAVQVACAHNLSNNYSRLLLGGLRPASSTAPEQQAEQQQQEEQQQWELQAAEGREFFAQMGSGLQASLLGAMAATHSDDAGLRLPPLVAPTQVLIVPLLHYRCDRGTMAAEARRLSSVLEAAGVRVEVDWRRRGPAGVRFGDSERRGVPLRIELGPRDVKARTCVIAQRHRPGLGGKLEGVSSDPDALVAMVRDLLDSAQSDLRWDAASALQEAIVDVNSFYELQAAIESGKWARGPWAGSPADEDAILAETGATLRCFPLAQPASLWGGFHTCLYSGYQASEVAIFARSL